MGAVAPNIVVLAGPRPSAAEHADLKGVQDLAYQRHAPALLRRLWQMSGDRCLAEDITQDCFVVAFRNWHECRDEQARQSWLHGIAYNLLRDARKTRKRRNQLQDRRCHGRQALPAQGEGPDDSSAQGMGLASELMRLLEDLDHRLRDVFVLRILEGQSLQDVAQFLNVSTSTVSERALKAEKIIRAALGEPS